MACMPDKLLLDEPRLTRTCESISGHRTETDLDTRAGDADKNAFTDEDHNEGEVEEFTGCRYRERDCWHAGFTLRFSLWVAPCTLDHFFPRLPLPLPNQDATVHARRYFDMAVKLYKAAKCDRWGLRDTYMRGAARALGHAIHLVEDMGVPQHTRPENHAPFPLGLGPSFHEYWILDGWDKPTTYTRPDGNGSAQVAGFVQAAATAAEPRRGRLEGIMGSLAAKSRQFFSGSPYEPGNKLPIKELVRVMAESDVTLGWVESTGPHGEHLAWRLPYIRTNGFPIYGRGMADDERHTFSLFGPFTAADYREVGRVAPTDEGEILIDSFELSQRLWAEPDVLHADRPAVLDAKIKGLLTATTESAAGAILAFWDEVRDYNCKCMNFTPCDFRPGAKDPDCQRHSTGPKPPGGDFPDDTPGVVSTTSSVTAPQVSALSSADLSSHWPAIASIGVEKELPSLIDFGRVMYLLSLAQLADLPAASQEKIRAGITQLEAKYSVNRARPEDDMLKAAYIGVLDQGFAGEAAALVDTLGWTHSRVPLSFDPLALAEDRRILLVPSGGLYGTAGSADLKRRLEAFVDAGGTLLVMAQMLGEDFTSVPTPPGEILKAYGWFEDQSCWRDNIEVAAAHPLTAAFTASVVSIPVDGYIERWPSGATVLLRKQAGGMPVMVAYALGAGQVVVTTAFEDWADSNGRSTGDGDAMVAGIVRWGVSRNRGLTVYPWGSRGVLDLPVTIRNLTEADADTVVWGVRTNPSGYIPVRSEPQIVAAGSSVSTHVVFTPEEVAGLGLTGPGIYALTYSLEDSSRAVVAGMPWDPPRPWVVQPAGEAAGLVLEQWPAQAEAASAVELGIAVASELVFADSIVPVHISVRNSGPQPFSGLVTLSSWRVPSLTRAVAAGAGALGTVDVGFGPLQLTTGHDGLPGGGSIVAELRAADGGPVLASVVKHLLNNPTLLDLQLEADEREAGLGDELHVLGLVSNHSMGEVDLRYQMVFTNHFSPPESRCHQQTTGWRPLHIGRDDSVNVAETYQITAPCNGIIEAELLLCTSGERCWTTGEGWTRRTTATVELPGTRVELLPGEFDLAPGPAFRIPVRVRNVGKRPITGGTVGLSYLSEMNPPEVRSAPFELARNAETVVVLDLPLLPGALRPTYRIRSGYRDAYWLPSPDEAVVHWGYSALFDLSYGGRVNPIAGFTAPAGSTEISAEFEVENRSSATRHFVVTMEQDTLGVHERREFNIAALQSVMTTLRVPVPSPNPYGRWPLTVRITDGARIDQEFSINLEHTVQFVSLGLVPSAASYAPGSPASIRVDMFPGAFARPFPVTLEFACETFGIAETRGLSLESQRRSSETFAFKVPDDYTGGTVPLRARLRWPDGTEVTSDGSLLVPPPRFTVTPLQLTATAGGTVAYEVGNLSVTPGTCEVAWTLTEGAGWVAQIGAYATLDPGSTTQVTFTVPAGIKTGTYAAAVAYRPQRQESSQHLYHHLTVTGSEAGLTVGTGRSVYVQREPIDSWAAAANGAMALPGATLTLKVLAPTVCEEKVAPWGTFQGSAARDGVSFWHSLSTAYPQTWFCFAPLASLPPAASPVAEAAGDCNEDGADDLLALFPDAGGLSLALHTGPDLAQAAAVLLPGASSMAALTALDADGDGHLEVIEADTTDGTALAVRCLSRTLAPRWETRVPIAGDPGHPFPAGGPLVADLDGGGTPALIVSSGRDVVGLTASGGLRWRMTEVNPSLADAIVTGIAAADCDRDGRTEIAVGLRSPGGGTGALALLGARGELRWLHATARPIAGHPVFTGNTRRVLAFVQTPDAPGGPSTLTVLDAVTGGVTAESTAPFRSAVGPAAGDLNGDGASEFVVASDNTLCEACTRGIVAFSPQATPLWSRLLAGPPNGPPLLIDMDNSGTLDVIVDHATAAQADNIVSFRGSDGASLSTGYRIGGPQAHGLPLLLLNHDGDCSPGFVTGRSVAKPGICQLPNVRALGIEGPAQGQVVWHWEGLASLAPGQRWDFAQSIALQYSDAKRYYLVGDLKNAAGQTVAHAETMFSVVQASHPTVILEPLPQACRSTDEMGVTGGIKNPYGSQYDFVVAFLLDDHEQTRRTITVGANATAGFAQAIPAATTVGVHTLTVKAWPSTLPNLSTATTHKFRVVTPALDLSVDAPNVAGRDPFTLLVRLGNPTPLALALDVGLDVNGAPPGVRQKVELPPGGVVTLPFQRQQARATTYLVRVNGDVTHEIPVEVRAGIVLEFALADPGQYRSGESVIGFELTNRGELPWEGDFVWTMNGATTAGGSVATSVAGGANRHIDVPLTLLPGVSTVRLAAGDATGEFTVAAYPDAYGALSVTVPESGVEGDVAALVRVENLLGSAGTFQLGLDVTDDTSGRVVALEHRQWTLAGDQTLTDTISLSLAPGEYRFAAALDGGTQPVEGSFTVGPRFAAELETAVEGPDADGLLTIVATTRNTGGREITGNLLVNLPGAAVAAPTDTCNPGESRTRAIPLDPETLPTGDLALDVQFVTGSGQVLARSAATVQVTSGRPMLSAPPTMGAVHAGASATPYVRRDQRGDAARALRARVCGQRRRRGARRRHRRPARRRVADRHARRTCARGPPLVPAARDIFPDRRRLERRAWTNSRFRRAAD